MNVVKREATLKFLQDCKKLRVLPRTFRINHRVPGVELKHILEEAGFKILKKALRNARGAVFRAKEKTQEWCDAIDEPIPDWLLTKMDVVVHKTKDRLKNKYDKKTWMAAEK